MKNESTRNQERKEALALVRKQRQKQNRSKLIFSLIVLIALTALVIVLFVNFGDIRNFSLTFHEITQNNNWVWLFCAFLLIVAYLVLYPFSLYVFCHALKIQASFSDTYEIGMSEHFYSGVTPFATGGQPFQVYFFKNVGVPTDQSTGAVLATFGAHLIVTNIYAIISLFFFPYFIKGLQMGALKDIEWMNTSAFVAVVAVGYFFNLLTLAFTFLVGANDHMKNGIVKIMVALARIPFLKKMLEKQIPTFTAYCDNTQKGFHEILSHKKHFILSCLIRFVTMFCYYAIPYFLLKGLGAGFADNAASFWVVFFSTSFAITAVVWVPTPGATGGLDYMFAIVIGSLTASGLITSGAAGLSSLAASLLWRMFTYYFPLLVSFVISLIFELKVARRMTENLHQLERQEKELSPDEEAGKSV